MHRIADHGMAWHGILETRAHRSVARRGRVLSDDFFGKHYGRAGEQNPKNPTPPTRESPRAIVNLVALPPDIQVQLHVPIPELGGSKNSRSVLDS